MKAEETVVDERRPRMSPHEHGRMVWRLAELIRHHLDEMARLENRDGPSSPGPMTTPEQAIRDARKAKGWSQAKLADAIGVTPTTVSRWERGHTRPRSSQLAALGSTLQVPYFSDLVRRSRGERRPPARMRVVAARIARVTASLTAHIPARRNVPRRLPASVSR